MTRDILDHDVLERTIAATLSAGLGYRPIYVRRVPQFDSPAAPAASANLLRNAAIGGSIEAQVGFAHVLLAGHGVARDPALALRWFRAAASAGNADAFNMVGRCHELGLGTAIDYTTAASWYRAAADLSHAWGQFNLASLLAQGKGVPVDHREAVLLLVKSARKGNAKAMNMLGRYRSGNHDRRGKPRSAALWHRWAAMRGCFRGQFHYGVILAAAGAVEDATRWLSASLEQAPADFRTEAAETLTAHGNSTIRQLGLDALGKMAVSA
jgi:TPR repeat protein